MTPNDVITFARDNEVEMVDFRFIDVPGTWQHFSAPIETLDEETFEEGLGFDGSSVRGFQTIDQSDMILIPDPLSAKIDPFTEAKTLILICNVKDPVTLEMYTRDPGTSPRKPKPTCSPSAWPTRPTSDRKPSFTSSTTFVSPRSRTPVSTGSTPVRAGGTRVATRDRISATRSLTSAVISPYHRWILSRTCARAWC